MRARANLRMRNAAKQTYPDSGWTKLQQEFIEQQNEVVKRKREKETVVSSRRDG